MSISKSVVKRLHTQKSGAPVFVDQAEKFLKESETRRNKPLRPKTLKTYRERLNNDILPYVYNKPLDFVDNKEVKHMVGEWTAKGVSARTIHLNFTIIKQIRRSCVNENGEQRYPYEWNSRFIDLPEMLDNKATVGFQAVQDAISKDCRGLGPLAAILAGTGLRIQEALALGLGPERNFQNHWLPNESKLIIRGQRDRTVLGPTKTKAGVREVDLAPELNNFLIQVFKPTDVSVGFLFPLSEGRYYERLIECGIAGGFHTLRRFRLTFLDKQSCPLGLKRYWTGHAAGDVHESYEQYGKEIETRKKEAERIGLGFTLPEIS